METKTDLPAATPAPGLRAPGIRQLALNEKTRKWKHELVQWNGQTLCIRAPTVAAQKKILGHMPAQKIRASTDEEAEKQLKEAELSLDMSVTFDMKVERVIQCTYDEFGQRVFKDEDRAELEQLPHDDELLELVNGAVERLTKNAEAQGKASGDGGSA